jgi:general stress protein CsbA
MRQRQTVMASSSTAIPDVNPIGRSEQEPLLGRPGDAAQPDGAGLYSNLYTGTAIIAQLGVWILAVIVWASVFTHQVIFFSAHPLLNSVGVLLLTQGALILQPTHTATQKHQGAIIHSVLNGAGVLALVVGLIIVEINKVQSHIGHFESTHAILGLITSILLVLQVLVGLTQFYFPGMYGGVSNAKKIYKYHRMAGYVILVLALATIAAATKTFYVRKFLHIHLWAVLVAEVLILAGVLPRIKKQKIGL